MDKPKTPNQKEILNNKTGEKQEMVKNTKLKMGALALALLTGGVSGNVKKALAPTSPTEQKPKPSHEKIVSNEEKSSWKNPIVSLLTPKSANASEIKEQEKFAKNLEALEQDVKNSKLMPLQPTQEWQELMELLKKARQAKKDREAGKTPKSLTSKEKQRIEHLQKKEWEQMGKFVSVGTGPNSLEWKQLEETIDKINKITLHTIQLITDAYAQASGQSIGEVYGKIWINHPTEDRKIFNKEYFKELAKKTNGDENFARILKTGGIVDELFKRYEMFFRMTDWKRLEQKERERIVRALDNGYPGPDKRKNMYFSGNSFRRPFLLFEQNWDEVRFDSIGSKDSALLVMNYRMSNFVHIRNLFDNLLFVELGVPDTVLKNAITEGKTYAEFSKEKYNYKVK